MSTKTASSPTLEMVLFTTTAILYFDLIQETYIYLPIHIFVRWSFTMQITETCDVITQNSKAQNRLNVITCFIQAWRFCKGLTLNFSSFCASKPVDTTTSKRHGNVSNKNIITILLTKLRSFYFLFLYCRVVPNLTSDVIMFMCIFC